MIKKLFSFLICFIVFFSTDITAKANQIGVSAQSAVLMCVNSGEVLFSKNENKKLSMASTTKIMTSLIALEEATPEREIIVTSEMVSVEGTSMGLKIGDSVSLRELVYGMMLQSGNDAANTVAHVVGGSPENFAKIMNERAKQIGMNNTNFVTASGLDDKMHYSTAFDMALLAAESIKNPEFRFICSQKSAKLTYGNPPYPRTLTNHNRLLWKYSGSIGIKTGFTKKSGRCLVSAAERNGITLVAVTLNAGDDWNDHISMFEFGFSKCESVPIECDLPSINLKVFGGDKSYLPLKLSRQPVGVKGKMYSYRFVVKQFEYAPIDNGKIAGTAIFSLNGKIVDEIPLVTDGESQVKKYNPENNEVKEKENKFSEFLNKIKSYFNLRLCYGVHR